jgi:RNA polymerase-binding transcription factor DksA
MRYRYLTIEQRETLESLTRTRLTRSAREAALKRLHQGNYGTCIECESDIAFVMLQEDPLALYCRSCVAAGKPLFKGQGQATALRL